MNDKKRKSLFKCNCGNNFISSISDVKQNKRKSCGCKKGNTPNKYTYGDLINGIKFIKTLINIKKWILIDLKMNS